MLHGLAGNIALLSFRSIQYQNAAEFSILVASFLAGISGFMLLSMYNKRQQQKRI